jgi:hypothetical protein
MLLVGFEVTISMFEGAKIFRALDRAAKFNYTSCVVSYY